MSSVKDSLKRNTIKAIAWNAVDKGGSQLLYIATGIILARILSPTDFGLVGMLTMLVVLSNILLDSGFGAALMRKVDCTEQDYNTVFYINLILSLAIYIILFLAAPFIATFFNQPSLTSIARVIFLALIFNSFGIIQSTILLIEINNKAVSFANLAALLLSSIIAVIIAVLGFAVWALVAQTVFLSLIKASLLWVQSKWRPGLIFSKLSMIELFPFSINLMYSRVLSAISNNAYSFFIGKFYSPQIVGYYAQGMKWSEIGSSLIYTTIQGAAFQVFSNIKDEHERLIRALRKTIRFSSFLLFPVLLGATMVGKPLIIVLLTEKWTDSILIFQWLCIGGLFSAFASVNSVFLQIKGRSDIVYKLEAIKVALVALTLFLTINSGIVIIVIGQVLVRALFSILSGYITGKRINYPLYQQMLDMLPYFGISILMVAIIFPLKYLLISQLQLLLSQVFLGVVFYILVNKMLNSNILSEVVGVLFRSRNIIDKQN